MRVTISEFMQLSREDQAKVTCLDLYCDGDVKPYWRGCNRRNPDLEDDEEYVGETDDRGHQ